VSADNQLNIGNIIAGNIGNTGGYAGRLAIGQIPQGVGTTEGAVQSRATLHIVPVDTSTSALLLDRNSGGGEKPLLKVKTKVNYVNSSKSKFLVNPSTESKMLPFINYLGCLQQPIFKGLDVLNDFYDEVQVPAGTCVLVQRQSASPTNDTGGISAAQGEGRVAWYVFVPNDTNLSSAKGNTDDTSNNLYGRWFPIYGGGAQCPNNTNCRPGSFGY
jgi:hypothetical protein